MHTFSEKDSKLPDLLKSQRCIYFQDKTILFFKLFRVGVKPRNLSNLLVRAPITMNSCFVGFKVKNHRVIKSTYSRMAHEIANKSRPSSENVGKISDIRLLQISILLFLMNFFPEMIWFTCMNM